MKTKQIGIFWLGQLKALKSQVPILFLEV